MEPITLAILAASGASLFTLHKYSKTIFNKKVIEDEEKCIKFINYILEDKVIFRKTNSTGILKNVYQASDEKFYHHYQEDTFLKTIDVSQCLSG